MKTLNRPMFRYGGPIKEGVMNGIREPKRNGGSMANNEGPRRAALVGNPIYPKVDGRTNHVIPAILGAGSLIGRYIAPRFGKYVAKQIPKLYQSGAKKGLQIGKKTTTLKDGAFEPNKFGRFFSEDPLAKTVVGGSSIVGKGIQGLYKGAKYATTTPSGLLFLGAPVTVAAGRYFLADGKELTGDDLNKIKKGGADIKGGGADTDPIQLSPEQIKENEAKARMEKMDSYREILDIKGMSKDAAYKSLIDASKIIQEGGNLKKQLKDGSLIQKVTAAASKNFNKVSDTETALRSLVAKGEITKDMNKEDKALSNELIRKKIAVADKQLSGDTFLEKVEKFTLASKGTPPSGATLANLMRTSEINVDEVADTTAVLNWLGKNKGKDEIDYIVDQVKVGITNGNPLDPGVYVVRDRIVIIDENGNVKPGPI